MFTQWHFNNQKKRHLIDYFNEITNLHSKSCLQRLLRFSMDRFNYCFDQLVPVCSGFRSLYFCRQQESKVYTKPLNSLHSSKQLFVYSRHLHISVKHCLFYHHLACWYYLMFAWNVTLLSAIEVFCRLWNKCRNGLGKKNSSFPQWLFIYVFCLVFCYTLRSYTF